MIKTAAWGDGVVRMLSEYIRTCNPKTKGWSYRTIYKMVQLYETYSTSEFNQLVSHYGMQQYLQPRQENDSQQFVPIGLAQIQEKEFMPIELAQIPTVLFATGWSNHQLIMSRSKTDEQRLFYMLYAGHEQLEYKELLRAFKTDVMTSILGVKDVQSKHRVHYSLGLFLAQYLCNGFNLADAGRITYDRTYYAEGGRCLKFERHKTHRNVNGEATVIVPIITPLQNILDQIAAKPSKGARVFPDIFKGSNDERVMRKLCVQENSNIKDRVIRVCKEVLGWEKEPSSTWARHAFASNLKMLKVPEEYVSEGMGHSQGNNITRGYQDKYPLEMRFEFNNKLLNLKENQEPEVDVDSMTPEEMKEFIKRMIGK